MTTDESNEQADVPAEGDVLTYDRVFTVEEVCKFGQITGDEQPIHTEPDEEGRLVVQGLLTGSLMTKIGGDMRYIGRTMEYEFRKPVRTGESITCEWTVESKTERDDRYILENHVIYYNDSDDVVIDAVTTGLIWR